jgi:plasmid stabilization system protein ParE
VNVVWTQEAKDSFNENVFFLEREWNEAAIENFIERTDQCIAAIEKHPLLYPVINKKKGTHKCLITKQVSLYYRCRGNTVELITFRNNYRNPKNLKL